MHAKLYIQAFALYAKIHLGVTKMDTEVLFDNRLMFGDDDEDDDFDDDDSDEDIE